MSFKASCLCMHSMFYHNHVGYFRENCFSLKCISTNRLLIMFDWCSPQEGAISSWVVLYATLWFPVFSISTLIIYLSNEHVFMAVEPWWVSTSILRMKPPNVGCTCFLHLSVTYWCNNYIVVHSSGFALFIS